MPISDDLSDRNFITKIARSNTSNYEHGIAWNARCSSRKKDAKKMLCSSETRMDRARCDSPFAGSTDPRARRSRRYNKVINVPNSMTVLRELLPLSLAMAAAKERGSVPPPPPLRSPQALASLLRLVSESSENSPGRLVAGGCGGVNPKPDQFPAIFLGFPFRNRPLE